MNIKKNIIGIFIIALIVPPILAGLWIGICASFGKFGSISHGPVSLEPWGVLLTEPGFISSLSATLISGFLSTFFALSLALIGCYWFQTTYSERKFSRFLSPILAAPHSAIAIGFAFLITPSGWFMRAFSPWLTGFESPPQIITSNDKFGIALALGLAIKELPFLFFIAITALRQIPLSSQLKTAAALGHSPKMTWFKIIVPQIYRRIKLPIFIVLVFGISNVDMAIILGPTHPPTLAIMALNWFHSPQLEDIFPGSAAAISILIIAILSIMVWEIFVKYIGKAFTAWVVLSKRSSSMEHLFPIAKSLILLIVFCGITALLSLILWSFAWRWSFPNIFPENFSIANWQRAISNASSIIYTSTFIAISSATISLALVITWLEITRGKRLQKFEWVFYFPLLIPQIAFLFGIDIMLTHLGARNALFNVILVHCLFVLPYTLITLEHSWRNIDQRLIKTATALGLSPLRTLWRVRIPILLRPILIAFAISISVSIAQYLPTLFAGGGRVSTLTTEAITLASGSDRRVAGLYALLQIMIPLIAFTLASLIPLWVFQNRKDMHGGRA